jgi:uncharacterized protein YdeI (YjbR/CyaY-like superfamily)
MPKVNPNAPENIANYIAQLPDFSRTICAEIHNLIHRANPEVLEDWKWRIPVYHGRTSMVCGLAGFKKHVSLSFFHGSQMTDSFGLFDDDCNSQNSRIIKFTDLTEIQTEKVLAYLTEAFSLSEGGVKNIARSKSVDIPELLQQALDANLLAKENFEKMAYTYRKEYAEHIATAKQESTRQRRLLKVIENLEKGVKMHEQYKC